MKGKENRVALDSQKDDGGFLWKIEHEDTTLYLLGTIHTGYEEMFPLNEQIEQVYEEADVLLPEINWPNPGSPITEAEMTELATFSDGRRLTDVLSTSYYSKLLSILEPKGITAERIHMQKPWFINEGYLYSFGNDDVHYNMGVDSYFLERAVHDGKEIQELEGQEVSLRTSASFSMDLQVRMLEDAIDQYEETTDNSWMEELTNQWLKGEDEAFHQTWPETSYGEEYDELVLFKRNRNNVEILDGILQENSGQTYMGLIGLFHMLINPSILDYLEEEGYTVERIL